MRRTTVSIFATALALSGFSRLMAQEPPKMLRIFREEIKQGKDAAHEKVEAAYVRAFSKINYVNYFGLTPITGPTEAWFLEPYDSYASLDSMIQLTQHEPLKSEMALLDAQDGELRTNSRTLIAVFQPALSYPGKPVPGGMSKFRYFSVTTVRNRPGRVPDFTEWVKMQNAARAKMNVTRAFAVYSVASGAPGGTYLVFTPMASLKALDDPPAMTLAEALGETDFARYRKMQGDITISTETALFAINPKMSHPAKETVDGDPDFWGSKPAAKKAGTQ